jgi:predicted CopG family antitoxin
VTVFKRLQSPDHRAWLKVILLFVYHVFNMKTITIGDDTYRRLESVKGGKSFSETIDQLISSSVTNRIDRLLEIGPSFKTGREEELLKIVRATRKRAQARTKFETDT